LRALSFRDQVIAQQPIAKMPDPDCDLNFVPLRARKAKLELHLMNFRGLGGSASSLVVDRV